MERPSEAAHACSGVEEAPITTVWQTAIWTVSLRHHCFGDLSFGFALVFLLCFVRLCSFFWSCSVFDHSRPPYFLIQLTHILAALETSACDTCDLWTIKKKRTNLLLWLPSFGASFGSPEGLRILLEPGQVALTGLRVGVLPYSETGLKATNTQTLLICRLGLCIFQRQWNILKR